MFAWLLHKPDKHGSGDPGCPGPPVSLKAPKSFSSPRTASHFLPASPLCSAPRLPPAPKLLAPQPAGVTRKCRGVRAPGLLEQWGMGVMGKCPFLSQGMILRHAPTLLQGVSDAPDPIAASCSLIPTLAILLSPSHFLHFLMCFVGSLLRKKTPLPRSLYRALLLGNPKQTKKDHWYFLPLPGCTKLK